MISTATQLEAVALRYRVYFLNIKLSGYDQIDRYGGEKFVILLPATNQNKVWGIAEHIRLAIQFQPSAVSDDVRINLTVNIGIAQFNHNRDVNQNIFFERVDKALYIAKQTGRNRIICSE